MNNFERTRGGRSSSTRGSESPRICEPDPPWTRRSGRPPSAPRRPRRQPLHLGTDLAEEAPGTRSATRSPTPHAPRRRSPPGPATARERAAARLGAAASPPAAARGCPSAPPPPAPRSGGGSPDPPAAAGLTACARAGSRAGTLSCSSSAVLHPLRRLLPGSGLPRRVPTPPLARPATPAPARLLARGLPLAAVRRPARPRPAIGRGRRPSRRPARLAAQPVRGSRAQRRVLECLGLPFPGGGCGRGGGA